ncbi:MAG: alpha/beta hydrolase [Mucilaginibacter sp.]|nr:alpha/beta hydrolase [Mucilaginibacter sp.]
MNKALLSLILILLFGQIACSRQHRIQYGDNPAAGKYYKIRGIKMYAEVYGTGKPLLLIHGNGGSISAFRQNIPYFSKKYKVIAVDSRSHGKSVDSRDSLSFEMMADDFAALLDQMHIDSAYVIGWSDGGINALLLAMRHPEKVVKLASSGANLTPDSLGLTPSTWKDMVKQYQTDKNKPRTTLKEKNDWKIFMLDYEQPNIPFAALKAVSCPSLIICGDHDVIPIEHTTKIYQAIPRAYLWVVPGSGHPTLQQHRDEFNKLVDEFFEKPYHRF